MELAMKVAEAVHVLNHDTQSCNRVAANQWLVQFQQTRAAWDVATNILTSDRRHPLASNFELEFFAAQILKRKVFISLSLLYSFSFEFCAIAKPKRHMLCQGI
ncbi:transportin MOS14 [Trifolium repens]|nr:transportin MOS14 [Trifolium repens]